MRPRDAKNIASQRRRYMTICVAALAAEGKAIICVSDKALTYGDYIQSESDISKILTLNPSGCVIMISGEEEGVSKVLAGLIVKAGEIGQDIAATLKICEEEYRDALNELIESHFLKPRL